MTKSMFRDVSNTAMSADKFGIGSAINAGNLHWMVVLAEGYEGAVTLVDMVNMTIGSNALIVGDVHHLSEKEARELVGMASPNWTFSDFGLCALGYKIL